MITPVSRLVAAIGRAIYGVYVWSLFLVLLLAAMSFATALPGLQRRRRWVSACARTFFRLAGMAATVRGAEHLPEDHSIAVANHASYLDGVILQAYLPARFGYVIKGEVRKVPVMHFVLRRIGARFVERFAAAASARDARRLVKAAATGESLAFFPEGTFLPQPGLSRFRPGAFAAAIKGELPLVPVVIRGSRKILPAGSFLPRPSKLRIDILEPIDTRSGIHTSSGQLAELARQRILGLLDEPDLAARPPDSEAGAGV